MTRIERGRFLWQPILPLIGLIVFVVRVVTVGGTPVRIAGLAITVVWLALALHDWRTQGRVRRWLYGGD